MLSYTAGSLRGLGSSLSFMREPVKSYVELVAKLDPNWCVSLRQRARGPRCAFHQPPHRLESALDGNIVS
jgi:hypothetical protein